MVWFECVSDECSVLLAEVEVPTVAYSRAAAVAACTAVPLRSADDITVCPRPRADVEVSCDSAGHCQQSAFIIEHRAPANGVLQRVRPLPRSGAGAAVFLNGVLKVVLKVVLTSEPCPLSSLRCPPRDGVAGRPRTARAGTHIAPKHHIATLAKHG